ncbi:hypothetical protein SKAU_G00142410 [Synaphobranchus kaupii]|uniref:Peptidase S1 domain-containing protein n=1 Tax=Synaphobranchus kaupii TaxID=118154 RepID=A0A9Q1FSH0_SYNKA|nr:hypothetical protein SKAU_G00142410 [Synaphobranchus kaupii]
MGGESTCILKKWFFDMCWKIANDFAVLTTLGLFHHQALLRTLPHPFASLGTPAALDGVQEAVRRAFHQPHAVCGRPLGPVALGQLPRATARGPLLCQAEDGRWTLTGVTSRGQSCSDPTLPGVYTRTSRFLHWIEHVLHRPAEI